MAVVVRTANEKSALLEAAYDDYCRQQESSQRLDVEQFLSRYSTIRSSLRRQIEVHDFLADRSHVVDLCRDAPWPEIGTEVLDFTILEELGRGAFARVYLCRQAGIGERQVVVKFASEGAYEADTLGRLSHPNIMPVHSVQFDDEMGLSAICMPFRGRSTLCDLVDRTFSGAAIPRDGEAILSVARQDIGPEDQLDESGIPDPFLKTASYVDGVAYLGIQLAEAIGHAHQRGIRHNDLKPSNVLLTATGRPVLLDFNLANNEARGPQTPGGTLPYMSPEQLTEFRYEEGTTTEEIDERSDVFSLGVILFELLSGRLPFGEIGPQPGPQRAKTLAAAQARGPANLRKLNPRVDQELVDLIERCLSVDKSTRPANAKALAADLRRRMSLIRRGWRWGIRHRVSVAMLCVVGLLCSGMAAGYHVTRDPYPVRQYKLALGDFQAGDYDGVIGKLDPILVAAPNDADALNLRGMAHMQSKRYAEATDDLDAARRILGKLPGDRLPQMINRAAQVHAALGYCLCRRRYFKEGRYHYSEAVKAGYEYLDARGNIAHCYLQEGKYSQALERLIPMARDNPGNPQILLNLLRARLGCQDFSDSAAANNAVDHCNVLIKLSPPNAHIELLASRICALASRHNPELVEQSLLHLDRAQQRGLPEPAELLAKSPTFAALEKNQRFVEILERPGHGKGDPPPDELMAPVPSSLWPYIR